MYSRFTIFRKYLAYYLKAASGKGHGIHSPFVYEFVRNVLPERREGRLCGEIEKIREHLLGDHHWVEVEDFGAGSAYDKKKKRKVSTVAAHVSKSRKAGRLLHRIVQYYKPSTILELGTCLGISTAYLAAGHPSSRCITIEGSNVLAQLAAGNFSKLGLRNIELVEGTFDQSLPPIIASAHQRKPAGIDLVFVDGNHQYEPTLRYFHMLAPAISQQGIIIFDDIHWSRGMEKAWLEIRNDPRSMLTIDLFFLGILFFGKEFKVKQHFTIRF